MQTYPPGCTAVVNNNNTLGKRVMDINLEILWAPEN